ncbi:hypothetical protein QEM02_004891 [Pseudomonas putida]|nr:hypothetical protein [Pseudomonas putida]
MVNQLKVVVRNLNASPQFKCALDSPKAGVIEGGAKSYLALAGWVYSKDGHKLDVVVSHMPDFRVPLNKERPDVKAAMHEAPLMTGFRYPVEYASDFKVGVKVSEEVTWLFQVKIEVIKVLRGSNGHLFLDNDLNRSADQFAGRFLIPEAELEKWDKYFEKLNEWSRKLTKPYSFMVAPAKEYIYTDSYPLRKGLVTPLEQFYARYSNAARITDVTESLYRDREFAYYKTDSHWNDYGASLAASEFCRCAGLKSVNPDVKYSICPIDGDLGSKLVPVQLENALVIKNRQELVRYRVYDNNVKVRGGVVVYENPSAPNAMTLMIFGDSFSVSLSDFLSHSFSRVVRVFSGADVDWCAVEFEKPDYILVEMTSRFLIRSPSLDFTIYDEVLRKYRSMGPEELKENIVFGRRKQPEKFQYYVETARRALDTVSADFKGF